MSGASTIVAILAGAALGGLAGWWMGRSVKGDRRGYWLLNAAAVIVCAGLNFAGLMRGLPWLASGAIGLMGGAITGLKYGYAPSSGIWRSVPLPAEVAEAEPDAEPAAEAEATGREAQ